LSLRTELSNIVGGPHVHGSDVLSRRDTGFHPDNLAAPLAVYPAKTSELAATLSLCSTKNISIVPHGGLTGLSGGAISDANSLIVGLRRMTTIEKIDTQAATAIVQCGATLQSVEEAANEVGLSVGIDLGARGTATIGGMIATNAGGMEVFRNGSMRNRLLGIEAVLANGEILNDLSQVPKCNEGYDLKNLFCGAEGTLGIVTRAVLKLTPAIAPTTTLLIGCQSAADALIITRRCQIEPTVDVLQTEIMWRNYAVTVAAEIGLSHVLQFCDAPAYLIVELAARTDETEEAVHSIFTEETTQSAMIDCVVATSEKQRGEIWRIREESFIVDNTVAHREWYDISVPLDRLDETVSAIEARVNAIDPSLGIWVMGHLSDGNLHYTIGNGQPKDTARRDAIAHAVYADLKLIGGSFSAEHGIGTEKRASLAKYSSPEKMRLMKGIKQVFDPQGIMNPGKVL